jgi:hypothetical protein
MLDIVFTPGQFFAAFSLSVLMTGGVVLAIFTIAWAIEKVYQRYRKKAGGVKPP